MMRDYKEVKTTIFYNALNQLLRTQLPVIKEELETHLDEKMKAFDFKHSLFFENQFEKISHDLQWRLEIDFNDYQWSQKTIKPHYLGVRFYLEQMNERIVFNYNLYNSFNETLGIKKPEELKLINLQDTAFVFQKTKEIKAFLNDLPNALAQELKLLDLNQLEFLEDEED